MKGPELGLGIFSPKKPNRTEPVRTEPNCRFFGFFGSASGWIFRKFGHRVRVRFLSRTEPNSRKTELNPAVPKGKGQDSQCSPRPINLSNIYQPPNLNPNLILSFLLLPTPRTPGGGGRPQRRKARQGGARQCGPPAQRSAAQAAGAGGRCWRAGRREQAVVRPCEAHL